MERHVGIDPGKNGGIAVLSDTVDVYRMPPTPSGVWQILSGLDPCICLIEKVHATPQMGVRSAFTFGFGFGLLHGQAVAAGLEPEFITPRRWQKFFGLIVRGRKLDSDKTDKKNANKALASQLFPELKITHWNADALLIARYAKDNYCW